MTPQVSQTTDDNLQAEIDRLTYSAYLLTLDPGKAFSAAVRAIDGSLEETTVNSDLLERTVELALEEVLCESGTSWDGDLHVTNKYLQATTRSKRLAQGKLVDAILPWGCAVGKQIKPNPLVPDLAPSGCLDGGRMLVGRGAKAYWTQTDPDRFSGFFVNHSKEWRGRRDSNSRPLP